MTVVHERDIAAPPEVVWACVTDPAELVGWLCTGAEVDLRPGGAITWTHEDGRTVAGHVLEVVPHHRLSFTYGWTDGWLGVPAGSTTVELTLEPVADGTRLRLVHRDLELEAERRHRQGWAHFLDLLPEHISRRTRGGP